MSLQLLWSWWQNYPAQVVNGLALFLALAGSWLLLATRSRERRAAVRLLLEGEMSALAEEGAAEDLRFERVNRFFYAFAAVSLLAALTVSWVSTGLRAAL